MAYTRKELNARSSLKARESLGMSQSTAHRQLTKKLLYAFMLKAGETKCYRCKKPLLFEDFSMDHKEVWRNKPNAYELYFDLDNIAFSHQHCNSGAAKKGGWNKGKVTHGTSGYRLGCRCDVCKSAYSTARAERYARLKV